MWSLSPVVEQFLHRMVDVGLLALALPAIAGLIARLPVFFRPDPDDLGRPSKGAEGPNGVASTKSPEFVLPTDEPVESTGGDPTRHSP
jgi:hypothetical protein